MMYLHDTACFCYAEHGKGGEPTKVREIEERHPVRPTIKNLILDPDPLRDPDPFFTPPKTPKNPPFLL
jgi:hypothetical protein